MELKGIDALIRASRQRSLQRAKRLRRGYIQQIVERAVKSEKSRRVRAIAEIGADGTHRGPDPDSETNAMHHIVKVLQILLMKTKTDRVYICVDVAHVMEEYPADVISNQREAQFGEMK